MVIKLTVVIIHGYHSYKIHKNYTQYSSVKVKCRYAKLLGIITVDFDVLYEILIRYSAIIRYERKIGV